jgi:hypothetical protein
VWFKTVPRWGTEIRQNQSGILGYRGLSGWFAFLIKKGKLDELPIDYSKH